VSSAVVLRDLRREYAGREVVRGVSLEIPAREIFGLLGPNGAGKTTLLRLLFGLVAADAGEIELLDRPLGPPDAVRLDGVGGFVEDAVDDRP